MKYLIQPDGILILLDLISFINKSLLEINSISILAIIMYHNNDTLTIKLGHIREVSVIYACMLS